ncbi:hypothetical protein GCM10010102_14490 [Promicromonospora citrea]|uniref:Uncharacterized protein n=1 Tax=Promicromonospora citrea TaxID=43677 RepID=A0A8H9GFS7_9MICO|nr:hypothetical protein [Promicromonospora citrea]GGM19968.1 hypothetical protein GCM10010102_14490 [Promicromonospora citrea]
MGTGCAQRVVVELGEELRLDGGTGRLELFERAQRVDPCRVGVRRGCREQPGVQGRHALCVGAGDLDGRGLVVLLSHLHPPL